MKEWVVTYFDGKQTHAMTINAKTRGAAAQKVFRYWIANEIIPARPKRTNEGWFQNVETFIRNTK